MFTEVLEMLEVSFLFNTLVVQFARTMRKRYGDDCWERLQEEKQRKVNSKKFGRVVLD